MAVRLWRERPRPMHLLLVASTGGHLAQLRNLADRLPLAASNRTWVTFDSAQSRSLLREEAVHFVRNTGPRDYYSVLANLGPAAVLLQRLAPEAVISTGAGIALPFLSSAAIQGRRAVYIESAARAIGPSLTGRILARVPGVETYTQYSSWASQRWPFAGSVFDDFAARERAGDPIVVRRVLVTLGTIQFPFTRLIRSVSALLPDDVDVMWQLGCTMDSGLRGRVVDYIATDELREAMTRADVVLAHAGIGSALEALAAGKRPVLFPRESAHGEHIDDHQSQIAADLDARALALRRAPETLTIADLQGAANCSVMRGQNPARLHLVER